ncbi:amino acid ABC transporter permease [Achromobacter spanius]|uniref:Amino acid ABC transporter permease n=1 Tax=Achromobacter spanius TaxID=217203 RepID=A0AAW3I641_9BURK|nr:amino acid ABC transporter permease [Achromobacter spanius]KNE27976.1 amino acid ABC transporter permease [Achromobacter spanius]
MNTTVISTDMPSRPAPVDRRAGVAQRLFGNIPSSIATVLALGLALYAMGKFIDWSLLNAVWPGEPGAMCRQASGACWAFLAEKLNQILFGIYPRAEQWRPAVVCVAILAMVVVSLDPRQWRLRTVGLWLAGMAGSLALMLGGWAGLTQVPTASWGGLPVTLLLAVCALGLGMPLGILLALARRGSLPMARFIATCVIELIRGLPLISLLFMASIVLPIMLPAGMTIDSLLRAGIALTIFSAAYLAEVIRGGLQSLPAGQMEASRALGLSWWQMTRLVVLPQAMRKVIAPLTNTAIVMIKNTSLVLIVGLFDLLSSGRAALTDPAWPTPYVETYLFIAGIYFCICFGLSRYSMWLEHRFKKGELR